MISASFPAISVRGCPEVSKEGKSQMYFKAERKGVGSAWGACAKSAL